MTRFPSTWAPLAAATLALGAAIPAQAAVIFKNARVTSATSANANVKSVLTTQNKSTTAKATSLPAAALTATSTSTVTGKLGAATAVTATARGTGTANFASAASGTFDATSNNAITQAIASTRAAPILSTSASAAYTFNYQFANTQHARLTVSYMLADPNAMASSLIVASLTGGLGAFNYTLQPSSSGSFSADLFGGNYSLTFNSTYLDRISRNGLGIGTTTGISADHFSFNISAVPEPGTWAMLILGFGLVGASLRRRRPVTTAWAA